MADSTDSLDTQKQEILSFLSDDNVKKIVLFGKAGVGKTWMAKEISNSASLKGSSYGTIWVAPGYNCEGRSLLEYIAIQLSVFSSNEELEEDDNAEMEQQERKVDPEYLKQEIWKKLDLMKPELEVMKTAKSEEKKPGKLEPKSPMKVNQKDAPGAGKDPYLLVVLDGSSGHPVAIIMIAEALNHVKDFELESKDFELESRIEEVASILESSNIETLLQHVYEMLPSILNKCCWHCRYLFLHHDSIHYNELITHWLLEGYFDHHDHIEKAYDEAHHTLMELIGRGFLRERENSYVYMESDALGVTDNRHDGLSGSARVGMASVLNDPIWAGIGRVVQTDGMVKTSRGKRSETSTLLIDGARFRREVPETSLIDGARFCREVPETFFPQLKVLVILNPMFKILPLPSKLKELQILILRGCHLLESVDEIQELTKLLVLEISGACLVKQIRDDLFETMKDLRSLNLSEVGIKWLPTSVLNRRELRWLILRKCPNLEQLCDAKLLKKKEDAKQDVLSLAKLEVLDFSGSESFQSIQVKTLNPLQKLQILNLSKTKIGRLPFFHNLGELTRLLLSDCSSLARLPTLRPLPKLEILVLSRTTSLKEVQDDCQETKTKFRVLDLNGSTVNKLPSNINGLSHLLLSGCIALPKLPSTQSLKGLKELDLSDASILEEFEDDSFEHLNSLHRLIFSNTKIKALPSLPEHSELRFLLLKNCKWLTELQNLSKLQKLECLDLSGCSELLIASNDSFQGMTKIKEYPYETSNLTSLRKLNLEDMKHMKEIDWKRIKSIPEEFKLGGCGSLSSENSASTEWPSILICGTKFLQFMEENSKLWDTCFQKFHFCVWPPKKRDGRIYDLGDWGLLTDIKSQGRIPHREELGRYLEIHGSYCISSLPECVLEHADHISLIDNSSFSHFSEVVKENLKSIKSCWLDRCMDIESIVNGEEDARASGKLEFLYVCNLSSLRCVCDDKVQAEVFGGLKSLYIECCAMLTDIFPLSKLPKKLETIQIKFCDEMRELFDHGMSTECNLQTLDLMELPKLEKIGVMMVSLRVLKVRRCPILKNLCPLSDLPKKLTLDLMELKKLEKIGVMMVALRILTVGRCPHLENLEEVLGEAENLETLHISHAARLKTICNQKVKPTSFKKLEQLKIESCPQLKEVSPSSELPPHLRVLEINSCERLETIFGGSSEGSSLSIVQLRCLPKLSSTGFEVLPQHGVSNCPKLHIGRSG
ncbi:hypothetical protein EUGRSUZ_E03688 [Eucalyptus grandis]|uniref:Uncharacterized protein n=1 Tax=Eucalyptus grandis TaxID=71139 RepID=A0ACC3KZD2_EUCGR|nr:hypothetical protein EUGRSUZ_E03688 [Eucalyptus grandis]